MFVSARNCDKEAAMSENYATVRQQALDELAAGDAQAAFRTFRVILSDLHLANDRDRFADALEVFARIGSALAGDDFAMTVRAASRQPDNIQALYELGYELIEQGLPSIAATTLMRANTLAPGQEPIIAELVTALERDMRYDMAYDVLRAVPELLDDSFMCRYLLAFNAIMIGDLNTSRSLLPQLQPGNDGTETFLAARIAAMLGRADAIARVSSLDTYDLRGWHYVLTGGILLHLSPHGIEDAMRGRYAFIQDSETLCIEGVHRLKAVLAVWRIDVPQIFMLPDRDSAVLAHTTAQLLERPLVPWPVNGSDAPGLIVAYNLAALDGNILATLHKHRPGQILWSHTTCWIDDQPIAADLTTFLYQFNRAPWGERMTIDSLTNQQRSIPADERAPAEIGAHVAATALGDDALTDLPELIALAQAAAANGAPTPAALRDTDARERQWAGSPVPSNRFL
jgi:hypothetical protein